MSIENDKPLTEPEKVVRAIIEPGETMTDGQLRAEFLPLFPPKVWDEYQKRMDRQRQAQLLADEIGRTIFIR